MHRSWALTRRRFLRDSALAAGVAAARSAEAGEAEAGLPWLVGTGRADLTPPLEVGILMSTGRRLWQPFEGVRLPLEARVLVVERAGRRAAVASLDLLGLGDEAVGGIGRFKQHVAAAAGDDFVPDDLVLCSTHTHSAPASLGCTDLIHTEPFRRWVGVVARQIGSALREAADRLQPCRLAAATAAAPGHTVNRRIKTTQGIRPYRTTMPAETVIGPEGPTDASVSVAAFVSGSGRPLALVVNASCHPVHEMCIPQVSPDFPGELCRELDRRHPGCTAVFWNGAAGNLNPPRVSGGAGDAREHGLVLADAVDEALGRLRPIEGDRLALRWQPVEMPARDPKGQALAAPLRTRIGALRLGGAAFCFLPGEAFIETSLAIRDASPWQFTAVVGYAEEWIGYVATDRAFDNGGYETNPGSWSKVQRGSEGIFRRQALRAVASLTEV